MAALTPDQIAQLKKAGFTPAQIQQYQTGAAPFALKQNVERTVGLDRQSQFNARQPTADTGQSGWANLGKSLLGLKGMGAFGVLGDKTANQAAQKARTAPPKFVPPTNADPNYYENNKSYAPGSDPRQHVLDKALRGSVKLAQIVKNPKSAAPSSTAPPAPDPYPTFSGAAGNYTVPNISPGDFTEAASKVVSDAYAPLFQMLESAKGEATGQADRARTVVGGLYDKLVNDIATEAAKQSAGYDASKQTATDQGTQLGNQIAQNYSSGNQQTADLLQKIGAQAAAPQVLQQGANDQAFAQSQAAQSTGQQQKYYDTQKQGQADYNTQLGNISRAEGIGQQENILNQLQQTLAGFNQQGLGYSSEQAQKAIDLAQQMTQNDLSAQTSNAGFQQSAQQMAMQQAQDAYQAQVGQYNATQDQNKFDWQRQTDQAAIDNQMAQLQLDRDKLNATIGGGAAGAAVPLTPDQYTGTGKAQATIMSQFPQNGDSLINLALSEMSKIQDKGAPDALSQYLTAVGTNATANRLDPNEAIRAALTMWNA